MSVNPEELAEKALRALSEGDPREARKLLMEAVQAAPNRPDLINALGVVQLQLGEPELGKPLIEQAIQMAVEEGARSPDRKEQVTLMVESFLLGLAAACEDLDDPNGAADAFGRVLAQNPGQPRARVGMGQLQLAAGALDEGRKTLALYVEEDRDEDIYLRGVQDLLNDIQRFLKDDIHPREFLAAHRGAYVEFFDHHADEQARLGWIAEAARMRRAPDGRIVPMIPEGARPYAAVRVDLVNPQTSEVGQIGDQPMVVALAGYQSLARGSVLFTWRDQPFDVRVSSQAPWDQLPIHLLFTNEAGAQAADAVIGDWYLHGWNGAFGSREAGRFHYISDPDIKRDGKGVIYHVDMGRASLDAIDDLLRRLVVLHQEHPIRQVIFGRGHLS